jgi:hypothetical protein
MLLNTLCRYMSIFESYVGVFLARYWQQLINAALCTCTFCMHEAQKLRVELLKSVAMYVRLVRDNVFWDNSTLKIPRYVWISWCYYVTVHFVTTRSTLEPEQCTYTRIQFILTVMTIMHRILIHSIIGKNWLPHVFSKSTEEIVILIIFYAIL